IQNAAIDAAKLFQSETGDSARLLAEYGKAARIYMAAKGWQDAENYSDLLAFKRLLLHVATDAAPQPSTAPSQEGVGQGDAAAAAPTPRTDAMIQPIPGKDAVTGEPIDVVHADDCRTLEREIASLTRSHVAPRIMRECLPLRFAPAKLPSD